LQITNIADKNGSLRLSPGPLSLADRDRERGGGRSGEAAVSLTAEHNICEINNYCSSIFFLCSLQLLIEREGWDRCGRVAAVWLTAAAITVKFVEINIFNSKKWQISMIKLTFFTVPFALPASRSSSIAAGDAGWGGAAVWLTAAAVPENVG
jgi:hypothetical protein